MAISSSPETPSHTHRWALAVGVNYYHDHQIPDLRYCASDATALVDMFLSQTTYGFAEGRTRVLTSTSQDKDQARRLEVMQSLIELAQFTKEDDLFLFYFSGHGTVFEGQPYLILSDTKTGSLLPDTAIPLQRVKEVVQNVASARARVIILDACYMGAELRTKSPEEAQKLFVGSVKDVFEGVEGIAILASSSHNEPSLEDANKQHGAFTYYLLDALRNPLANNDHDDDLTLTEVFRYVTNKVRHDYPQRPTLQFEGTGEIILLPALPEVPTVVSLGNVIRRTFPASIKATTDFYNRQTELEQIRSILSFSDTAVLIRGDRCTGKTSLLNRIKNMLTEEDWQGRYFAHLTIGPRSIHSVDDLAHELWDGLHKALTDAGFAVPNEMNAAFLFKTYADFAQRLERLSDQFPDLTFVAFIDDFDKIILDIGEVGYKRIVDLIHYIVEQTRFPLFFFMFLLRDLPDLYGSTVASRHIHLRAFSRDNTNTMVAGILGAQVSPAKKVLTKIYEYGGGNPYFTKLLLDKLYELSGADVAKWSFDKTFREAVRHAANSLEAHGVFSNIYNKYLSNDEKYVLAWVASKDNYLLDEREVFEKNVEIRTALKDLCERDYLVQDLDGSYHLQIALMGEWFRGWSKSELELKRLGVVPSSKPDHADLPSAILPHGICIDESTQQIHVDGKRVEIEPTELQYRALVYFVQYVGQIVSRDELVNHLHPDETYLKSDQSLAMLIHRLRDLLGDRQKPNRFLETVYGRGFRLRNAARVRTIRTKQERS